MTRAAENPSHLSDPITSDAHLLLPQNDVDDPELTILIPAMNEELTVGDFVAWCHEGMREAGVVGEILIVDSSTDRTAEIALAGGARVLRAPSRGVGRAYIDALPHVRGRYVMMGDADCTYDFRKLRPFVEAMRDGNEFVMGSRWKGSIEPGANPVAPPVLRQPPHNLDTERPVRQPLQRYSQRACVALPATHYFAWVWSLNRGNGPRRWY